MIHEDSPFPKLSCRESPLNRDFARSSWGARLVATASSAVSYVYATGKGLIVLGQARNSPDAQSLQSLGLLVAFEQLSRFEIATM